MRKILTIIFAGIIAFTFSVCEVETQEDTASKVSDEQQENQEHTISYVSSERMTLFDEYDCIAVYTQYTNNSSDTTMPADQVDVKAFQNGVELPPMVPTGERTNGYIQCDTNVQSGVATDVVWFFELDDDSTVTLELSNNEKVEIQLTE